MKAMKINIEETDRMDTGDTQWASLMTGYQKPMKAPGGRHDNDHADIKDIVIFPTASEIKADLPDYLPSTNRDMPHHIMNPVLRHLDTQFRLLRHDTFNELKSALVHLLLDVQSDPRNNGSRHLNLGDLRANQYKDAFIQHVSFKARGGLEFEISFPRPTLAAIKKKSEVEQLAWWKDSKRLSEGSLATLSTIENGEVNHIFFIIVRKNFQSKQHTDKAQRRQSKLITITSKLANICRDDLYRAIDLGSEKTKCVLIEFPGIIPATFTPILENLQLMRNDYRLPFQANVLPERAAHDSDHTLTVSPPLYARREGFMFSLQSILRENMANVVIHPKDSIDQDKVHEIQSNTFLDEGQSEALIAALTREFAFIQGPPGTGKTYLGVQLMKVLLDHRDQARLGPIIVVCYTNHALDQFLEHLIANGIKSIIRIGRQSKSEILERYNLSDIARNETKTKSENYHAALAYKSLENTENRIQRNLAKLQMSVKSRAEWKYFQHYLERHHPKIAIQFQRADDEGYEVVGRHPFEQWMEIEVEPCSNDIDILLGKASTNVYRLVLPERRALVNFWSKEIQEQALHTVYEETKEGLSTIATLHDIYNEASRRVLQECKVIGVTTTGLAKSISLLQHVQGKVVVCEEAGEVMEPHILCAMLPAVQHFIQIGDHQQLRPQINTYDLSMESQKGIPYQLDRSQFERLSIGEPDRPKMPLVQLNQQRRMRPEISTLLRQTLYPRLQDHPSTLDKDDVVGIRSNLFWLDHSNPESSPDSELHHKSHSNEYEVRFVQVLVRHIIRQGVYKSSDIAILTPYTGQLSKLRAALRNDFEVVLSDRDQDELDKDESSGVEEPTSLTGPGIFTRKRLLDLLRVATVDNFQGEEAKVVIVSLVRSNDRKKVGFLHSPNRINVLLSRAQNGMYLIGNSETYQHIKMWQQVIDQLRKDRNIGTSIGLCCPRHPNTILEVSEPDDFSRLSPEGGCQLSCGRRLDCGHTCHSRCHAESMHSAVRCSKPCQRLLEPCKHTCQKATCGELCGPCKVLIQDVQLPCGHVQAELCYRVQDISQIHCSARIKRHIQLCGHEVELHCGTDINAAGFICPHQCTAQLSCGHQCPGKCGTCQVHIDRETTTWRHQTCTVVCKKRKATCEHLCPRTCHVDQECGLCRLPCEIRCKHSSCEKLCFETCAPCIEPCTWSCKHQGKCTMPCGAPCNRLPCDERCDKLLSCGHRCPGACGEDCLEQYCQGCGEKADHRVDLLEFRTYSEIDLDMEPVIALACGHFFTIESLDGMTGMQDVYATGKDGYHDGLQDISFHLDSKIPTCPDCKAPFRQYLAFRYGRLVNRAVVDDMTRRFITTSQTKLLELSSELEQVAKSLEFPLAELRAHVDITTGIFRKTRRQLEIDLPTLWRLYQQVGGFFLKVGDAGQPAHKIHQAMIHASKDEADRSIEERLDSLKLEGKRIIGPTRAVVLEARLLQLKCAHILLAGLDAAIQWRDVKSLPGLKLPILPKECSLIRSLHAYQLLIADCQDAKLSRLTAQAILGLADVVVYCRAKSSLDFSSDKLSTFVEATRKLLDMAVNLCLDGFQDADCLKIGVELMIRRLNDDPRYESVTEEEKEMIKAAMIAGRDGIASHSGHWYNCANGHPVGIFEATHLFTDVEQFAIGECGMPMELARCPECDAPIGGQHHRPTEGVSRATEMED